MVSGIRSSDRTLAGLFSPGTRLVMPPYQRSYSWDVDEARELLGDIIEASDAGTGHFIGTIVLVEEDGRPSEIVDGQQRLTTLTILLAVLRDLETRPRRANEIAALLGDLGSEDDASTNGWRLSLNYIDGPYFRDAVQTPGGTLRPHPAPGESESRRRLATVTDFYVGELTSMAPARRDSLFAALRDRVSLVKVAVRNRDDGYRVFRVLNTRGKAPNSHDIIKTDLLESSAMTMEEAEGFARAWQGYEAELGGSGFDDLLQQICLVHDRDSKRDTPSAFRKAVMSKRSPVEFLTGILPRYVAAYRIVSRGEVAARRFDTEITDALAHLRTLDHQLWRAPALKFLVEHSGSAEDTIAFFRGLERLGFAMMLIITSREQRLKRYGKVSDAIGNRRLLLADNGPLSLSKDERRNIARRLRGRFATFGQRRCLAFRVNTILADGPALAPESDATVEHVLPRALVPGSPWQGDWPDMPLQRELCDTLGNFVLLPGKLNQKADRMGYGEKKALYFSDEAEPYPLTRDIAAIDAWTPDAVRTRTDRLAGLLCVEWGIG